MQALTLTAPEVAVLDRALTELHSIMRSKRTQVHSLEEELEADNPEVFAAVQVGRGACFVVNCAIKGHSATRN